MDTRAPEIMFSSSAALRIVAVGLHGLRALLEELAPDYRDHAEIIILDKGYGAAAAEIARLRAHTGVDAVVSAGSNGGYLRQHLDIPVALVKTSGLAIMRGLARASAPPDQTAIVMYGEVSPELSQFNERYQLGLTLRAYRSEDDADACVRALRDVGVRTVVAPGMVVDLARAVGLEGILLYSQEAVREAMEDAIESARLSRLEAARREKLNTILAQLQDGVVAVAADERIETINPAMEAILATPAGEAQGQRLSVLCPELGLQHTLRNGRSDIEEVQQVNGRTMIVSRMPIVEQGRQTGAVLICQDPVAIQRLDRNLRTRARPQAGQARYGLANLIGKSDALQQLRQRARKSAASEATVLIVGESGTGKELLAQGIHNASARKSHPFIAINCAAFPEALLESELFGYVEGAFTGSLRGGKIGLFEAAHTGTLFLDEIGEMPLSLQTRLLRVLQEKEVLRIGATRPTPVDVRVIAATHRDLREQVDKGVFRQDLYYRLNILLLQLPPLRDRLDDLPLLALHLVDKVAARLNVAAPVREALVSGLVRVGRQYAWPGNIRELENLIERALVFQDADPSVSPFSDPHLREIAPELFADYADELTTRMAPVPQAAGVGALADIRLAAERDRLIAALNAHDGNREQAAKTLGISRSTLWRKMREHNI